MKGVMEHFLGFFDGGRLSEDAFHELEQSGVPHGHGNDGPPFEHGLVEFLASHSLLRIYDKAQFFVAHAGGDLFRLVVFVCERLEQTLHEHT